MSDEQASGPVKTAVVTGGHSFDVPAFHRLFRMLEGVDAYIQHMEDFCSAEADCRAAYDVAVFYHMFTEGPDDEGPWYAGKQKSVLATLGQTGQGIVLLHHAILAYPKWPAWRELAGIEGDSFTDFDHSQTMGIHVVDADHPITQGLADWETVDETYTMADADDDNHLLLTTDHPKCMKTIAWTRRCGQARVFCYQLGHDAVAFENAGFREVLRRGIQWAAGRI